MIPLRFAPAASTTLYLTGQSDFALRAMEHVGRAFGESLRAATIMLRCGSAWSER
jgi:hypothetical protein